MTVAEYMANLALQMAANDKYGYSNKWPENRFDDNTPYDGDCGAFVSFCLNSALEQIGISEHQYYEPQGGYNIYNEAYLLKYCERYFYGSRELRRGDIIISGGHTVMVTRTDPDYVTHASMDYDGKTGDSSGREIRTERLYNSDWHYVYRLREKFNKEISGDIMGKLETLKKGSTGNQVKNLQALLNLWLTSEEPLITDGIFGDNTEAHLRLYQSIQHLEVDGICGHYTWEDILLN